MTAKPHTKQGFRTFLGILFLGKIYGPIRWKRRAGAANWLTPGLSHQSAPFSKPSRTRLPRFAVAAKRQRRFSEVDAKIVSMSARGMTMRKIPGNLEEIYNIELRPDLVSAATDAVFDEAG